MSGVWEPRSILDGFDLDGPPERPELGGLAYRGALILLSCPPDHGKTWLALVLGIEALAHGGALAVVDADVTGQRRVAARLRALGLDNETIRRVRYSDDPHEWLGTEAARARFLAWAERQPRPVAVVLDSANPMLSALGFALDEAGMSGFEARVINPLKRLGATVVMPDHTAIRASASSPYSISTQRKHAAADVHLRLQPSAGSPPLRPGGPAATFTIIVMKDKPGGIERERKLAGRVTFTPGADGSVAAEIDLSPPTADERRAASRPTALMERVSGWAADRGEPFSKSNVTEGAGKVRGNAQALRAAVDRLNDEGYLERNGDGFQHVRLYRQIDDPEAAFNGDGEGGPSLLPSPGREDSDSAGPPSPRPASSEAGSRGAVPSKGRGRPESGQPSPSAPYSPPEGRGGTGGEDGPDPNAQDNPPGNHGPVPERALLLGGGEGEPEQGDEAQDCARAWRAKGNVPRHGGGTS